MTTTLGSTLLLLFFSGVCHGDGVIPFDLLRVPSGEAVTFTTKVQPAAAPFVAVTWSFNGTTNIITSTTADLVGSGYEGRVSLNRSTGALELRNLTERDSGDYELIIITDSAEQLHGTAALKVFSAVSKPSINCPTVDVVEGQSFLKLACDAQGSVTSRVWTKDGQPLPPGDKYSFSEGNRVLSINAVDRGDTGQFRCNASNEVSFATAECDILVYYGPDPPRIIQKPNGAELEDSVKLTCSSDSLPAGEFVWTFKNLSLKGKVFRIDELEKYHLGKYTCTVTNPATGHSAFAVHNLRDSAASVSGSLLLCVALTSFRLVMG